MKSFSCETKYYLPEKNDTWTLWTNFILLNKNGVISKHCEKKANHKLEENTCKWLRTKRGEENPF